MNIKKKQKTKKQKKICSNEYKNRIIFNSNQTNNQQF